MLLDRGDERHDAVARYIDDVNEVSRALADDLGRASLTYEAFQADARAPGRQVENLVRAERAIGELHARVERLRPPPDGARLHEQLLRLIEVQEALATDTTVLARYLPRLEAEERNVGPAAKRLQRDLRRARTAAEQGRAFGRYASALAEIAGRIERLSPPAALEPVQRLETARIGRLARVADRVRGALAADRPAEAVRLARVLAEAGSRSGAATGDREAILAYNRRVSELQELRAAVETERTRLGRKLG